MKHFILLQLTLLLSFSTCTSQQSDEFQIGKKENSKFVITANLDKVKAHWTSVMKIQKNLQQISDILIIAAVNKETGDTYYLITGKNSTQTFTIANEIFLRNDMFYFRNSPVSGTVTCSGCNYGCNPEKVGTKWFCDSDCGSNCNKSVTVPY